MCNTISQPCSKIAERDDEITHLADENARLRHRIALLEKALFGPHSERLIGPGGEHPGQQVFEELLKELEGLNAELAEQEEPEPPKQAVKAKSRKRPPRNIEELVAGADLPKETVEVEPPAAQRVDPQTGAPLKRIEGHRTVRLAHRPGSYYLLEYHYPKYVNPSRPRAGVVQAPARNAAVLGGSYDESFMAKVVYDKCAKHLPLYRQAEELRSLKLDISRQTLSRLYMHAARTLAPVWLLMKSRIIDSGVIFTDDTPVNMLYKGRRKTVTGRMWVYIGGGKSPPYRVFEFTIDRSQKRPQEFLKDFRGYIHADAYQGYDKLFLKDGVQECGCWMHVRRKYVDAADAPPELREEVLRAIRKLYIYERFIWRSNPDGMSGTERDKLALWIRQEKIAPLIDRLFKRTGKAILNGEVLPDSAFAKAIGYMHNLGEALKTFIQNPCLKPDNGQSERAIRPLAIGRKNWLFAGCKEGGDATGILLSLVQTCRAMGVQPLGYLQDVLSRISDHPASKLHELLPDQWTPIRQ